MSEVTSPRLAQAIAKFKSSFTLNLTADVLNGEMKDKFCSTVASAILEVSRADDAQFFPGDQKSKGDVALELLELVKKEGKDDYFVHGTKEMLWAAVTTGWLKTNNHDLKRRFAFEIAWTRPEHPVMEKAFEKTLSGLVRGKLIDNHAYKLFFDEAPRQECHTYPAIRIVGQEFVRDHPNCFMHFFKVGGG
jgi:hypothetical protein